MTKAGTTGERWCIVRKWWPFRAQIHDRLPRWHPLIGQSGNPILPCETPILSAFGNVIEPWPALILFGRKGFITYKQQVGAPLSGSAHAREYSHRFRFAVLGLRRPYSRDEISDRDYAASGVFSGASITVPSPLSLTTIFTASSIGSLMGTSIRSRPCS